MENFNFPKHTVTAISGSNQKNFSTNRSSATHPSVHSKNRDYLETIFKKLNSGDSVLSRIPSRIDPSIEFSDDEDDEPINKKQFEKSSNRIFEEKENRKIFSELSQSPAEKEKSINQNTVKRGIVNCPVSSEINTKVKLDRVKTASTSSNSPVITNKIKQNTILQYPSHQNQLDQLNKESKNEDLLGQKKDVPSLPNEIINVNGKPFSILSLLGSGGSCKVYSVYDIQNKSRVAIKRVNLNGADPSIQNGYKQEIEYLQKLQNSNRVIKMYDFEYRENELLIVLEHGDIDFAKYISNEAKLKRLTPLMIKFFWSQMLEAVADIHKYGIVHCDLKPANFLLVAGHLKLIDFGIATSVPEDKTSTFRDTQVGTLNFMSPEAITHMSTDSKKPCFKVGVKSDVWSLGCILYNLVYGTTPFQNIKILMQKIYAITNPNYEIPFKPLHDPLLLDVLKSCLKRNPKERASVEELLQHPYLAEDNNSSSHATSLKPNENLNNVLKQMQVLTPRRMKTVTKFIQELTEKSKD